MKLIILTAAAAAFAAAVPGCGGSDDSNGPTVVATTGVLTDIVEEVAGDSVTVKQLIPDGASPHDFSLSAQDRQQLEQADLVVDNGAGLEAGLPLDEVDAPRWTLADHAGELLPAGGESGHEGAEQDHEGEGAFDPHIWMDPTRVVGALPSLAAALGEAAPGQGDSLRKRAYAFARRLRQLDREIARTLSRVSPQERNLVTSHDSLGYFAARYDFEVIATSFPSSGPEAEPSAARLADVEEAIEASGVPAIFAQADDDPDVLVEIGEHAGVEVVTDLLVEAPGDAGSYVEMLRRDAELIASGLGG